MTITNGYATVNEFQAKTGLTADQALAKTTLIEREIERNSRMIDRITGDRFYSITLDDSNVRFQMGFNPDGLYMSDDCKRIYCMGEWGTVTSVESDGVVLVEDEDYFVGTNYIEATGVFSYDRKVGVTINGTCGFSSVPDDINAICLAMTEVSTGLGTYTMIDSSGSKMEVTRDSLPDWVNDRLMLRRRFVEYG